MGKTHRFDKFDFPLKPQKYYGRLTKEVSSGVHKFSSIHVVHLTLQQDKAKILLVEPMKKLPSIFLRNEKRPKLDPPRFHYGWVLEDANCVYDVAKELDIQPHTIEYDQAVPESEWVQDYPWMQSNAFTAVTEKLGLEREPYLVSVICQGKPQGRATMISLVENITVESGSVLHKDIKKLKEYFGKYFEVDDGPMWYLDGHSWTWNSARYRKRIAFSLARYILTVSCCYRLNVSCTPIARLRSEGCRSQSVNTPAQV